MNKTKDGRIIEKRVKLDIKLLKGIIEDIKQNYKLNWKDIGNKLSISPYTIRQGWLRRKNTIPLSLFKKLIKLHPKFTFEEIKNRIIILKPYWGQKLEDTTHLEKEVKLPKINSKKFAEFYGAMLGDGCIYSNLSGICISGHSILDRDYLEKYMNNLILNLFKVKPTFYYSKKQKGLRCILYSKKIALFLKDLGFPIGKKVDKKAEIPKLFLKEALLIKNCIKGLADTDGSVYSHRNKEIIVDITIYNKSLLKSSLKAFNKINLNVKCTKNRLYLYGKDNCLSFFKEIGSSNLKHVLKYNSFIDKGIIPRSYEIENLLKEKYIV